MERTSEKGAIENGQIARAWKQELGKSILQSGDVASVKTLIDETRAGIELGKMPEGFEPKNKKLSDAEFARQKNAETLGAWALKWKGEGHSDQDFAEALESQKARVRTYDNLGEVLPISGGAPIDVVNEFLGARRIRNEFLPAVGVLMGGDTNPDVLVQVARMAGETAATNGLMLDPDFVRLSVYIDNRLRAVAGAGSMEVYPGYRTYLRRMEQYERAPTLEKRNLWREWMNESRIEIEQALRNTAQGFSSLTYENFYYAVNGIYQRSGILRPAPGSEEERLQKEIFAYYNVFFAALQVKRGGSEGFLAVNSAVNGLKGDEFDILFLNVNVNDAFHRNMTVADAFEADDAAVERNESGFSRNFNLSYDQTIRKAALAFRDLCAGASQRDIDYIKQSGDDLNVISGRLNWWGYKDYMFWMPDYMRYDDKLRSTQSGSSWVQARSLDMPVILTDYFTWHIRRVREHIDPKNENIGIFAPWTFRDLIQDRYRIKARELKEFARDIRWKNHEPKLNPAVRAPDDFGGCVPISVFYNDVVAKASKIADQKYGGDIRWIQRFCKEPVAGMEAVSKALGNEDMFQHIGDAGRNVMFAKFMAVAIETRLTPNQIIERYSGLVDLDERSRDALNRAMDKWLLEVTEYAAGNHHGPPNRGRPVDYNEIVAGPGRSRGSESDTKNGWDSHQVQGFIDNASYRYRLGGQYDLIKRIYADPGRTRWLAGAVGGKVAGAVASSVGGGVGALAKAIKF